MAWAAKGRTAKLLAEYAPGNPPALLEIGPGNGLFAREFSGRFAYTCLEPNAVMAGRLREEGFTVLEGRFPETLLEPASCDAVLMEHVFEHFASVEEQMQALAACFQALRPGGVLAVTSPDYAAWGKFFFLSDYTHNVPTSPGRTRQMLFDTGFELLWEEYGTCGLRGRLSTALVSRTVLLFDAIGLTHLAGQGRRMKIVSTLLRNFSVYGRKPTQPA
jgi:SAM-dependent methyltransferase